VTYRCDNAAVVAIVNVGRSKIDRAMRLMRCLLLGQEGVSLLYRHIPGTQNGAANNLFSDDLPLFERLVPGVSAVPAELSDDLLQCPVLGTPDWTMVDWISLFGCTS